MRIVKIGMNSVVLLILFAFTNSYSWALVAFDQNYNFNFRFNNPGARANAMGGAFIGTADDATAAYTNPAGLTILTEPEVSVEYKFAKYENTFFDTDGAGFAFDEEANGTSFLSLVFPVENATIAIYRHQLINIRNDYDVDPYQNDTETDIEAVTLGLSIALKLAEKLSVGVSVGFADLDYRYSTEFFLDPNRTPPPFFKNFVDGEDHAEHYTVSMLFNPISEFNIGMVYRSGPEFNTNFETFEDSDLDGFFDRSLSTKNILKVPDVYGIGISYRFPFGLTVAADANYIEYSDILEEFVFTGDRKLLGTEWRISDYDVDDTTETHVGLEYVFSLRENPLAIRCGYFFKPEHRIKYVGQRTIEPQNAPEGEDDHIFSAGLGAVFSDNIQIDVAAGIGNFEKEYTTSFVYRFN